jgi:hypothetical protein
MAWMARKFRKYIGLPGLTLAALSALVGLWVWGASGETALEIALPVDEGQFELSRLGRDWSRLCVLGPYTSNERAHEVLGFELDVETASTVSDMDNVALLVVISSDWPARLFDVRSGPSDFAPLDGQCWPRGTGFHIVGQGTVRAE